MMEDRRRPASFAIMDPLGINGQWIILYVVQKLKDRMAAAEPPGRRERKRSRTLDHLAATAFALFEARGYDAVTMEQVAAEADVASVGTMSIACANCGQTLPVFLMPFGQWTMKGSETPPR